MSYKIAFEVHMRPFSRRQYVKWSAEGEEFEVENFNDAKNIIYDIVEKVLSRKGKINEEQDNVYSPNVECSPQVPTVQLELPKQ